MLASLPGLTAVGMPQTPAALLALAAPSLAHLSFLDIAIIAIYFVMVIWIGFYLKGQANTSEEFFMACLLYTSPSPRDGLLSRMPSSA